MSFEADSQQESSELVDPGDSYQVRLGIFDGPMDLLLHLIRRQEIDIYDIPIARITDQYLQYLKMLRDLNITLAGDFVKLAATLIYIKSQMLLPRPAATDPGEEAEDPRQELVQQLLEHERFQKAAGMLYDRQVVELSVWSRGEDEFEEEEKEAVSAGVFDLIRAFHGILERHRQQIVLQVEQEAVSVEGKLAEIRRLLALQKEILFSLFLHARVTRLHLVVTFIALLEMARLGEVRLLQTRMFDDIRIVSC